MDEYLKDEWTPGRFRWLTPDFGGNVGGVSYFSTVSLDAPEAANAIGSSGPERNFGPLPGMVFLKEEDNCQPTSTGPHCVGGANDGKMCHMNAGDSYGIAQIECPGGTCVENPSGGSGCRVEIPLSTSDGGTTPPEHTSELKIFTISYQGVVPNSNPPNFYNLSAQTGNSFGGTSAAFAANGTTPCPITNRRLKPSMATRYLLPQDRRDVLGLAEGATYLRWDSAQGILNPTGCTETGAGGTPICARSLNATNLRWHTDDTRLCCTANIAGGCTDFLRQTSPEYPLLVNRTCLTATRPFVNDENIQADWIFVGGKGTAFYTDPEYINPGQIPGVCRNNRDVECFANAASMCTGAGAPYACCTGPRQGNCSANVLCTSGAPFPGPYTCCTGVGTGTCDDPCPGLGDTCDLREPGHRIDTTCRQEPGTINTRRDCSVRALYHLRGTPNAECALLPRMQYDGDPGKDCAVSNYGIDHRWDRDCNGFADTDPDNGGPEPDIDLCPFLTEWNQTADGDGDCGNPANPNYPLPGCRGDECECGDAIGTAQVPPGSGYLGGDGKVTVSDLVQINIAIFDPLNGTKRRLVADTNNDNQNALNVSDLVGANLEIFRPDSSLCRQLTPRQCGQYCVGGPTPGAICSVTADCGTNGICATISAPCCGDGLQTAGEACDDGNLAAGDGCNSGCRVEP
jgi:cysteine-rich repeat protein